ncbi:hypothetical protein AAKU55_000774 [Oxalobacteraceae bacterium GrIS 1.11]
MTHIEKTELGGASQEQHLQLAIEQAAMHSVNLAVARWSGDYTETWPSSTQSCWYAALQDDFAGWLAAGGFTQPETECLLEPQAAGNQSPGNDIAHDCACSV